MTRLCLLFALLALAGGAPLVQAQDLVGIPLVSPNTEIGGLFGVSVSGVPDADGDGRGDLLVGAQFESGGENRSGRAYLFSGADGSVLLTLASPNPESNGLFGISVSGVPDADGDGRGDLLVGAPGEDNSVSGDGRAYLFSGATGDLLQTLTSPNAEAFGLFGLSVSDVPDVDGDGRGDLLVGAGSETAGAEGAGRVYLFSGATGALLSTLVSPNGVENGTFGASVSGVLDANGDGRGDLLIGAESENGGAEGSGRAYLFDGATGALLLSLISPFPDTPNQFGISVSGMVDANGDGRGDLLIGEAAGGDDFGGRAHLFDGATGVLLITLDSPDLSGSDFGRSVSGVPDIDGDGRGDLLIGASREDGGALQSGRAYLFNGATGALLASLESGNPDQAGQFGHAVAGVPDVDGDGSGELLVGAFSEDAGAMFNDGRAYLFTTAKLVSVEPAPGERRATAFALSGAFPNPFDASTALALDVAEAGHVSAAVFDALGRRVAVLHDGDLAPGAYTLRFDASDLPGGAYSVRVHAAGRGVASRRVTVLR